MKLEKFPALKTTIDEAQYPVLAVLLAEGCEQYKGQFLTELETRLNSQSNPVHVHIVCYEESQMEFPRPLTQAVYYFAPQHYEPLFFRQGPRAFEVDQDIKTALQMISGKSYLNATYGDMVSDSYEQTENMLKREDISKFPSFFQQARNLAKEAWQTGKIAAQGLPVLVEADVAFQRLTICQGCEFFKEESRCEKCGCFMKTKTQLTSASCPVGKWK